MCSSFASRVLQNAFIGQHMGCALRLTGRQNNDRILGDSQTTAGKFYSLHSTSLAEVDIKFF